MNNLKTLLFSAGVAMAMFSACSSTEGKSTLTQSGLDAAAFDTVIGGKKVALYTLTNANASSLQDHRHEDNSSYHSASTDIPVH